MNPLEQNPRVLVHFFLAPLPALHGYVHDFSRRTSTAAPGTNPKRRKRSNLVNFALAASATNCWQIKQIQFFWNSSGFKLKAKWRQCRAHKRVISLHTFSIPPHWKQQYNLSVQRSNIGTWTRREVCFSLQSYICISIFSSLLSATFLSISIHIVLIVFIVLMILARTHTYTVGSQKSLKPVEDSVRCARGHRWQNLVKLVLSEVCHGTRLILLWLLELSR